MSAPAMQPAYASQATFRHLMDAFAHPCEIVTIRGGSAPAQLAPATAAILLCLADFETPVWLDPVLNVADVANWIRFHTGAPLVEARNKAAFAIIGNSRNSPAFADFALGSDEYPDRSATLIFQIDRFAGPSFRVRGPGIKRTRTFAAEPLPDDFAVRLSFNREFYPRGVDVILVAGEQAEVLPRSVHVTKGEH